MLSHYFAAIITLAATTVLSAPSRLSEARDVESHLSRRNFYWQCPQGQYFTGNPPPSSNPGSCTGCQPGTFSPDGVNCYKTPMGFYNDVAGAKNPIGCLPGSYTDSTGSTICKSCTAPMMSYAASTKCVPCADGSSSSDSKSCTPCDSGFFSTNGAVCNQCQPGSFYAGVACHPTPPGFYNDKPGASDPIGCLPGTYTDTPGSTACKACTLPFMSFAAATKCIPCADGSSSSDSISCKPCPSGTFSVNGAACNTCQPGTFFAGGSCHTTPAGYYNDKVGSADPNGCAAGMYSDQTGAIICQACASPLMSYAAFAKCIPCADGTTSTDGQYCHSCPAGQASMGGAACSAGNYAIYATTSAGVSLGYIADTYSAYHTFAFDVIANALHILPPASVGSGSPINLFSTTDFGSSTGRALAIIAGNGVDFADHGYSYAFTGECAENDNISNFVGTDTATFANKGVTGHGCETKIWLLASPVLVNGVSMMPLTISFIDTHGTGSPVTDSYFFGDYINSRVLLGVSDWRINGQAAFGRGASFYQDVQLYLVATV